MPITQRYLSNGSLYSLKGHLYTEMGPCLYVFGGSLWSNNARGVMGRHAQYSVGWNYLSIPKLQRLHRWSLRIDKYIYPTLFNGCNYLSMLVLKLIHLSKRGQWSLAINDSSNDLSAKVSKSLPEPMLTKYRLEHCVHTSVTVELKNPEVTFHENADGNVVRKMAAIFQASICDVYYRRHYCSSYREGTGVSHYSIIHVLAVPTCYIFF